MMNIDIVNFEEFTRPVIVARGVDADAMTRESVIRTHKNDEYGTEEE